MDNTTKLNKILEINLFNNFYFYGRCVDEDDSKIIIIDKNGDRVEIKKSTIMLCKEILNG